MSLELRKNRSLENITFLIDEIQSIKPIFPCFASIVSDSLRTPGL